MRSKNALLQFRFHRMTGLSVIELLVAMGLSILLVGGVVTMFVSSRSAYETNDRTARLQENARFALDAITRDIRASGYLGCVHTLSDDVKANLQALGMPTGAIAYSDLKTPTTMAATADYAMGVAVAGFDYSSTGQWQPALDATLAPSARDESDALLIRLPIHAAQPIQLISDMTTTASDLNVIKIDSGDGPFEEGQVLLISNCRMRSYFEVTSYDAKNGVIKHDTSTSTKTTFGNKTGSLGYAYSGNTNPEALGGPSELISFQSVVYYVREGTNGPALWRRVGTNNPEELVEGIESIQMQFGLDTDGDGEVNEYQSADAVADPSQIISVSIALLARSTDEYGTLEPDETTYTLLGDQFEAPGDRRLRQVFTTTATIRNAAL